MKLKTQFRVLSAASVLVPWIVAALMAAAASRAGILAGPGRQMLLLRARLERAIEGGAGDERLAGLVRDARNVEVILEDGGLARLAWNFPEGDVLNLRGAADPESLPAGIITARIGTPGRYYFLSSVERTRGEYRSAYYSSQIPRVVLAALLLIIAPLLTSVFLDRTLTSIRGLQEAARRISGGDLGPRPAFRGADEIIALAAAFDEMRISLRDEAERRARFLMSVSHDLKSPLTALRGYIEALRDGHGASEEDRERYLSIIDRKSMMLESRIREIVNYISMSTSDWQLSLRPTSLRPYLENLAAEFKDEASVFDRGFASRIAIDSRASAALDGQLFGRCLENIISNAIKYTSRQGTISMRCDQEGGKARLAISDDGPGIPEADMDKVFEPFYRGEGSGKSQGMGLGLSIVKSIMEAHGFEVSVGASGSGMGTSVIVLIPLLPQDSA